VVSAFLPHTLQPYATAAPWHTSFGPAHRVAKCWCCRRVACEWLAVEAEARGAAAAAGSGAASSRDAALAGDCLEVRKG